MVVPSAASALAAAMQRSTFERTAPTVESTLARPILMRRIRSTPYPRFRRGSTGAARAASRRSGFVRLLGGGGVGRRQGPLPRAGEREDLLDLRGRDRPPAADVLAVGAEHDRIDEVNAE